MLTYRKIIRSGAVLEIEEYENLPSLKHSCRCPNLKETSERQKKINESNALKAFTRTINTNFKPGDLYATLTYDNEHLPPTDEQADKNADNYIRKLIYHCQKQGLPFPKYIIVTGRGDSKRIHSHMIIAGVQANTVKNKWGYGKVKKVVGLWDNPDYTQLASYLFKHCKDKAGKRWKQSKNLDKPIIDKPEKRKRRFNPKRAKVLTNGYELVYEKEPSENNMTGEIRYYRYVHTYIHNRN